MAVVLNTLPNYRALLFDLEQRIEIACSSKLTFTEKTGISAMIENRVCNDGNFEAADCLRVDFTGRCLGDMVCGLMWVQKKKLQLRHTVRNLSSYKPKHNVNLANTDPKEREVDPCPLYIALGNRICFTYVSNFNGTAPQPGNCRLRRTAPTSDVFAYFHSHQNPFTVEMFKSESYKLHLAMEIVRRKGEVPNHTGDPFATLPVAVGVVMALRLVDHNPLVMPEFVHSRRPLHIFGGTERQACFDSLLCRYVIELNIPRNMTDIIRQLSDDCAMYMMNIGGAPQSVAEARRARARFYSDLYAVCIDLEQLEVPII